MGPKAEKHSPDPMDWEHMASLKSWGEPLPGLHDKMRHEAMVDCGWGRLIFGQTFDDPHRLSEAIIDERDHQRNVALYLREPHVILSQYPQKLFLDPSHTFRLNLAEYRKKGWKPPPGVTLTPLATPQQLERANTIYQSRGMVPMRERFSPPGGEEAPLTICGAVDEASGELVGVVMAVDHWLAFDDPDNGASLWALAVDPKCTLPGVGEALVRAVIAQFRKRERSFLDLSVMHDNQQAIALYDKLGFRQVPVYCVKHKNPINEHLFVPPQPEADLNIYSRIIVDEAHRRGIAVEVVDPHLELVRYTFGGRSILCRESLSELTSAVGMTICDDKSLTHRLLAAADLNVPRQREAGSPEENAAFLAECGRLVVKPARGEQGQGIAVDVRTPEALETAITAAREVCSRVLLEEMVQGQDLRIIVIDQQVVAAAVRKPAEIQGDGVLTIRALIEKQSRRRAAATHGESRIPLDAETGRCIKEHGHTLDQVLQKGQRLAVRKTANLHTGGTIHDVTARLHPCLGDAAVKAAQTLHMPVVGLDFLVPRVEGADYVIIEANERPGLANHEPQPTAERFLDLLFPHTRQAPTDAL